MISAGRRDHISRILLVALLLAAATWSVYAQVIHFDFIRYDDRLYVSDNARVGAGLTAESIAWAFTSGYESNWFPLTRLSHMLDVELFGLEPGGHHLTNALLHVVNALLLFAVLASLTRSPWRSAFAAALFALHPLQVESVAWVSERKNVLSTALGLLCLGVYGAYARRGGSGRYAATVALLALGLMAKPMLVTLPFVFLLLDYWPLARGERPARLLLEKLPLFALSVASSVVTLSVQRGGGVAVELPNRLANAVYSYASYLRKAFWPDDLALFYPHPFVPSLGGTPLGAWQVGGAAALLLAISALVFASRRRYAIVGWLWYLGTLVPVLGLVQVGGQAMADRYVYLPLIGIAVAVTWAGAELHRALRARHRRLASASTLVPVAVLAACLGTARAQASRWRDSLTLFEHVLEVTPRNPTIRYNLANALRARGDQAAAAAHYVRALEVASHDPDIHNNLGNALRDLGRLDEALLRYREAIRLAPAHARAHNNLGAVLRAQGRGDEAIGHFGLALLSDPALGVAHYNLGNALRDQGDLDQAVGHYRLALRLDPGNARAHNNLGVVLQSLGRLDQAREHYESALRIQPGYARAHRNLALVLQLQGEPDAAIEHYRAALRTDPTYAAAHADLGTVLHGQGRLDQAIAAYRRALEIEPERAEVRRNLEDALRERADRLPALDADPSG